jgi:hypothetical protein
VRFTFDTFGIRSDHYKERVKKGHLRADYDVIVLPTQNLNRAACSRRRGRPVSCVSENTSSGMRPSDDITDGFGAEGRGVRGS